MSTDERFHEDDRVADAETGALGTIDWVVRMIADGGFQRAYLVKWDDVAGDSEGDLRRADTLRRAEEG